MAEPKTEKLTIAVLVLFTVICALVAYVMILRREVATLREGGADIAAEAGNAVEPPGPPNEPSEPAAAAAPTPAPTAGAARVISESQRTSLVSGLEAAAPKGAKVWFATMRNAEANNYRLLLEKVFTDAGWSIERRQALSFPVKPGIFAFVADEVAPDYVQQMLQAFESAGIEVNVGTGYRDFYAEKKKESADYRGFDLKADQDYVLVIGRAP